MGSLQKQLRVGIRAGTVQLAFAVTGERRPGMLWKEVPSHGTGKMSNGSSVGFIYGAEWSWLGKPIRARPSGQSQPGWVLERALGRQEAGGGSRDGVTKGLGLEG